MYAPTAATTPTRLPTLIWTLTAALLLLSVFAPRLRGAGRRHAGHCSLYSVSSKVVDSRTLRPARAST
jgi:hypothetical protein